MKFNTLQQPHHIIYYYKLWKIRATFCSYNVNIKKPSHNGRSWFFSKKLLLWFHVHGWTIKLIFILVYAGLRE